MKKIKLIGLFLLVALCTISAQKKPLFPQMPGMVSYTYRNSFAKSVPLTLDTLKALGIKDMEFSNLFGQKAADIKKMLDQRGMFCSSFGTSYTDLTTKVREVGANANALGAKFVRVAWIDHDRSSAYTLDAARHHFLQNFVRNLVFF